MWGFLLFLPPLTPSWNTQGQSVWWLRVFPSYSENMAHALSWQTNSTHTRPHTVNPRLAHLRLGATGAPRWHRGGKTGHQEKGNSRRSVRVYHGWTNWVWLCVNRKRKGKKIHAQMDFQGWEGGVKGGTSTYPSAMFKRAGRGVYDNLQSHGCSQVPLRWKPLNRLYISQQ